MLLLLHSWPSGTVTYMNFSSLQVPEFGYFVIETETNQYSTVLPSIPPSNTLLPHLGIHICAHGCIIYSQAQLCFGVSDYIIYVHLKMLIKSVNPCTQDAEEGGSLDIWGQLGLQIDFRASQGYTVRLCVCLCVYVREKERVSKWERERQNKYEDMLWYTWGQRTTNFWALVSLLLPLYGFRLRSLG